MVRDRNHRILSGIKSKFKNKKCIRIKAYDIKKNFRFVLWIIWFKHIVLFVCSWILVLVETDSFSNFSFLDYLLKALLDLYLPCLSFCDSSDFLGFLFYRISEQSYMDNHFLDFILYFSSCGVILIWHVFQIFNTTIF